MTGPTFDERLDDWIKDGPAAAPSEVLDTVMAAFPTSPQRRGAFRVPRRSSSMNPFSRVLAGVVIVAAIVVTGLFVLSRQDPGGVGAVASPSPTVAPSPAPTPEPSVLVATPSPTASPVVTPVSPAPCVTADLTARITIWEGAAGSRIATVTMTNDSSRSCLLAAQWTPQLVDGSGTILIDGDAPKGSVPVLTIDPGVVVTTLVQTTNYCGTDPVAPVTIALVQNVGSRVVAEPFSATDVTLPPCNGPGQPAAIEMHPWAP